MAQMASRGWNSNASLLRREKTWKKPGKNPGGKKPGGKNLEEKILL
jgi:hypothetical protein